MPVGDKPSRFNKLFKKSKKVEPNKLDVPVTESETAGDNVSLKSNDSSRFNRRSKMFNPFKSVRKAMASVRVKEKRTVPSVVTEQPETIEGASVQIDVEKLNDLKDEVTLVEDCRKNRARGPQGRKRRSVRPPTLMVPSDSNTNLDSNLNDIIDSEITSEKPIEVVSSPKIQSPPADNSGAKAIKLDGILDVRLNKTDSFMKTEMEAENAKKSVEADEKSEIIIERSGSATNSEPVSTDVKLSDVDNLASAHVIGSNKMMSDEVSNEADIDNLTRANEITLSPDLCTSALGDQDV